MKLSFRWHILTILFFFGSAFLIKLLVNEQFLMKNYADKISKSINIQTKEIEQIYLNHTLLNEVNLTEHSQFFYDFLQNQNEKTFSVCFYQGDSLLFYTNNLIVPIQKTILDKISSKEYSLMKLINGYYLTKRKVLDKNRNIDAICFILLKRDFPVENEYLKNTFVADANINSKINLTNNQSPYPIQLDADKKEVCYIEAIEVVRDTRWQHGILALFSVGLAFLLSCITLIANNWIKEKRKWQGGILLISSFFTLNYLLLTRKATQYFDNLEIFGKDISIGLGNNASLIDILLSIIILSWLLVFFYRTYSSIKYVWESPNKKIVFSILNLMGIVICFSLITFVYKQVSFNDKVFLQLDKLYNINAYSTLALLGACLLQFVLFLLSYHAFNAIFKMELSQKYRFACSTVAVVIATFLLYLFKVDINYWYFGIFVLIYLVIFAVFIENKSFSLVWILIWLVIFSGFSAACIYKYGRDKDYAIRKAYAKSLASAEDSLAEAKLKDFAYCVAQDNLVSKTLSSPEVNKFAVVASLHPCFDSYDYLVDNYALDVVNFSKIETEQTKKSTQKVIKILDRHIALVEDEGGVQQYQVFWNVGKNANLEVSIRQNIRESSEIYKDLQMFQSYKQLQNLGNYSYAIYKNNVCVFQDNQTYPINLTEGNLPEIGRFEDKISDNRHDVIYRQNAETTVFIGKESIGLYNVVSFFSVIFTLMGAMLSSFVVLNAYMQVLPMRIFFRNPTLQVRIQMAIIGVLIGTLVTIGQISSRDVENTLFDKSQSDLETKLDAIVGNLEDELIQVKDKTTTELIANRISTLSKMNHIDIHYFNLKGQLVQASESDIFSKGIIAEQLNSTIYNWLKNNKNNNKNNKLYQNNLLGEISYRSAYASITDVNKKLIGFLELPFYSMNKIEKMEEARLSGSNQLNIYVLLFLVACAFSIFIANNITEPLQALNKKLTKFKLGDKNEPLDYNREDEIGALIAAYNQMINKVEVSSHILMENKRIDGFKEMASQASHDIKNALMPMKLSTEYLLRRFQTDPDEIETYLPRISKTILEHIELLAETANEFSLFADVRKADNRLMSINDSLSMIYELNRHAKDCQLALDMEQRKVIVYMDKNHMNRVITNLIKNAIEAIPEDRFGKIDIRLRVNKEKAIISVQDNGTGIPNSIRDSIFEFKFSTKKTGGGLGLPICRDFVKSINGEIYFESQDGIGTTFFIELPLMGLE